MKKVFLLCAFALGLGTQLAQAQTITPENSTDTLVNAATVNLNQTVRLSYVNFAFQVVLTKISGTVAGTVILQASLDGTNFVTVPGTDTLTLANVTTNNIIWTLTSTPYLYYRAACTGSGTMSAKCFGYVLPKK